MSNQQDCKEIRTMLDAYHDGEAQAAERELVDRHLSGCDQCKRELEQIRMLANSLRGLPGVKLKFDFADKIDQAIAQDADVKEKPCSEIESLLDGFFDHELPESEHAIVSKHLSGCEKCNSALVDIERVVSSLKQLPPMRLKRDLADEFEVVLAERSKVVPFVRRPAVWISSGVAAAVALMIFAANSVNLLPNAPSVASQGQTAPVKVAQLAGTQSGFDSTRNTSGSVGESHTSGISSASSNDEGDGQKIASLPPKAAVVSQHPNTQRLPLQKGEVTKTQIASAGGVTSRFGATKKGSGNIVSRTDPEDVIASYDADPNPAEELGISTDEDGLYAIKL